MSTESSPVTDTQGMRSAGITPEAFVERWSKAEASERANAQMFLTELTDLLGVARPSNSHSAGYSFEFPVKIPTGPDSQTEGRIDLYRRGCFVLETKQFLAPKAEQSDLQLAAVSSGAVSASSRKSGPVRGSEAWDDAMWRAKGQAERYVRHLPESEPSAPFLLVVDVGHSIEVYADFTQAGRSYLPFPDPRSFRLQLEDLRDARVRESLRLIWLDPLSLDPAKVSAQVTREIAAHLATLAASLEKAGHQPRLVAEFLTRCLFCMFAEDIGLLPKDAFTGLLESLSDSPEGFVPKLKTLVAEMQTGTDFSVVLNKKLLRFNGGLFEDASVLPLDKLQLGILTLASLQQWKDVEPAIFGTLLERALDPEERHQLGAHYTPRAYVERLVLPTIVEPLRKEWEAVRAAALVHAQKGDLPKARVEITRFHNQLCSVTVLDPACGSGNFLYVALEHLKRLEGEVLDTAAGFGENLLLDLATHSVDPHQFLGLEVNPRAASLAELVLWIGYLQWHFRTRGQTLPAEPVLKKFRNIECRDAVLAWDGEPQPVRDERGEIVTVWDRRGTKIDAVTVREVPDETRRVPLLTYPNARPAEWPKADYIIGNPPYIGVRRLKDSVGDGYVEAIRGAYPDVPETSDYVMYWWDKAARAVGSNQARRFGLITTNSIVQAYSRRLLDHHIGKNGKVKLVFAIADHQWVDAADGAAVRVAMTVGCGADETLASARVGISRGETENSPVEYREVKRIGTSLDEVSVHEGIKALQSNEGMCFQGVVPAGDGFKLDAEELAALGYADDSLPPVIRRYIIGRDLVQRFEVRYIIDFFGRSEADARKNYPPLYQRLLNRVYPERAENKRTSYREKWWIFAEPRPAMRRALAGLTRFIVTPYTATHRPFMFVSPDTMPDAMAYAFPSDDAFILGVLSSRLHVKWSLAAGGRLGVGNDPRYTSNGTFFPFPFPACDEAAKARIRALGEELDAHRKRVQAQHPDLSLTAMYNVLEGLRAERTLTPKEQATHDAGLVSLLRQLHDELDAAIATAYGWNDLNEWQEEARAGGFYDFKTGAIAQVDCTSEGFAASFAAWQRELDAEILTRLVALNAERAAEEAAGQIRWLRPEYQNPTGTTTQAGLQISGALSKKDKRTKSKAKEAWPKTLAERVQAVERILQSQTTPVTAGHVTKCFARAKVEDVAEILETLATLGRAQRAGETFTR
jgi:hypothetical protein